MATLNALQDHFRILASHHVWATRRLLDEHIALLTEADFDRPFHYATSKGETMTAPFAATMAHVFNHATHHRGQITAALTAMGHPSPVLDLIYMLRDEATAAPKP